MDSESAADKERWARLLDAARGKPRRDDPSRLKKAVRKAEAQKRKSAKRWAEREQGVAQAKQQRQAIRSANLINRGRKRKGMDLLPVPAASAALGDPSGASPRATPAGERHASTRKERRAFAKKTAAREEREAPKRRLDGRKPSARQERGGRGRDDATRSR